MYCLKRSTACSSQPALQRECFRHLKNKVKQLTSWEVMTPGHFSALSRSVFYTSAQTFLHDFSVIRWYHSSRETLKRNVKPSESQCITSALFTLPKKILSPWCHYIQVSAAVLHSWSGDASCIHTLTRWEIGCYITDMITYRAKPSRFCFRSSKNYNFVQIQTAWGRLQKCVDAPLILI